MYDFHKTRGHVNSSGKNYMLKFKLNCYHISLVPFALMIIKVFSEENELFFNCQLQDRSATTFQNRNANFISKCPPPPKKNGLCARKGRGNQ